MYPAPSYDWPEEASLTIECYRSILRGRRVQLGRSIGVTRLGMFTSEGSHVLFPLRPGSNPSPEVRRTRCRLVRERIAIPQFSRNRSGVISLTERCVIEDGYEVKLVLVPCNSLVVARQSVAKQIEQRFEVPSWITSQSDRSDRFDSFRMNSRSSKTGTSPRPLLPSGSRPFPPT